MVREGKKTFGPTDRICKLAVKVISVEQSLPLRVWQGEDNNGVMQNAGLTEVGIGYMFVLSNIFLYTPGPH